jgi:molybdopterin-guanine dinucleotide biosynthesis protein A
LERSAIILAVDAIGKFGDIGTFELEKKPLIARVVDAVDVLVDEVVIVTSSDIQVETYKKAVSPDVKFVVKKSDNLLSSAISGFEAAEGEYSALLSFSTPLVSTEVLELLFDCSPGKNAVIPRYTTQEIEPQQAVYRTKETLAAAMEAFTENAEDLEAMVEKLRGVRFMSMMVIEQLDPELKTYFSVKTPVDLKKAAVLLKPKPSAKGKQKRRKTGRIP